MAGHGGGHHQAKPYLLNATYAGVNDVHALLGLPPFGIKYEKCEIIFVYGGGCLKAHRHHGHGWAVFSLMPFGQTGLHSLTSVTFTPHETSYDSVATFPCQAESGGCCTPGSLYNCNECPAKPQSAWPYEPAGPQIPERRVRLCLPGQPVQHEADFEGKRN